MRHARENTDRTDSLTFYRTTDGTSHTMVPVLAKDGAEPCAVPKTWDSKWGSKREPNACQQQQQPPARLNLIKPRNKLTSLIDGFSKSNCADRIADYELWGGEHEVNVAYSKHISDLSNLPQTLPEHSHPAQNNY
uniref:Uncharacterized protein n=1 Tax=Anopheles coluzzii TaxID=1518534 RepID=A0A8W7PHR9_ANOCL